MYLYGGSGPKTKSMQYSETEPPSLWSIDLKTFRWEAHVPRGEVPPTRDDHSAVVYDNQQMIVFGGFVDGVRNNQILKYHFRENRWE